jgi:nitrate reductase gamma subunit
MEWLSFLIAGLGVYVAVALFLGGSLYRLIRWWRTPKSTIHQGMFPKPRGLPRALKLAGDTFVFPWVLTTDAWMWFFVIGMHLAGLGLFFGHTRLFGDVPLMLNLFGAGGMETLGNVLGTTIGIFLFMAFSYFLIRRMKSPYKELSVPADYLLLLLILLLILLGDHLRLTHPYSLDDYRSYMASVLAFNPHFPASIASSGSEPVLLGHIATADILIAYFPFSKLVHFFGTFAGNWLRSE